MKIKDCMKTNYKDFEINFRCRNCNDVAENVRVYWKFTGLTIEIKPVFKCGKCMHIVEKIKL